MIRKILNGEKVDDEKVLAAYYTKRDLERIEKEARRMQQDVMKRPEFVLEKKLNRFGVCRREGRDSR